MNESKFKNIVDKKFRTTYIGSIYAIEKAFGIKWDKELDSYIKNPEVESYPDLTDEMLDVFADIRDEILDIGNDQCRKLKGELFEYFEIEPKIYRTQFRVATGE